MQNKESILCLHQGTELYGSDRSFLSAAQALAEGGYKLEVILPSEGDLADEVRKISGVKLFFYDKGIMRKRELRRPIRFSLHIIQGVNFYLRAFSNNRIIYINTIVMLSALIAACFYRFSKRRIICHIREIPSCMHLVAFRTIFRLSGVELIYNSEATREAFGVEGKVIYNGVSAGTIVSLEDSEVDVQLPCRLLLIGRINQWKGQDFFVETLSKLSAEQLQSLRVRIVGSPFEGYEYLLDGLAERIKVLGLEDIVEIFPFCPDPAFHYQWADYVVVPSIQPEPFGRVAIEAFSFGKPVIASAHGGLVEIVESEMSGFLFCPGSKSDLANTIIAVLGISDTVYRKMSKHVVKRFKDEFSLEVYNTNIREFFDKV